MVLGLRCSNTDYYYALLSGTKATPVLEDHGLINYPRGTKEPAALEWMFEEIRDRLRRSQIEKVVLKGAEPGAMRTAPLLDRVQYEAAVFIACAEAG
jgi:hypothetical protein